ncbi:MAG: TatD family hydrolase [Defluviitaleaceae bacterium]|nr:TatD family hydrolase [Defluviitaleaceae bacterium]
MGEKIFEKQKEQKNDDSKKEKNLETKNLNRPRIFETHAHYEGERYEKDREELLSSFPEQGICHVINISFDVKSSEKSIALTEKYPFFSAAVGIHPHYAKDVPEDYIEQLEKLSKNEKVVAIGEIGLDFHYDYSPRDIQRKRFLEQLDLVRKTGLPVIIHNREADEEVFDILKNAKLKETVKNSTSMLNEDTEKFIGIMHCFSGDVSLAEKYISLGYLIGIGGIVTYKNANVLKEVVKAIPLKYLVVETDAPFLTPVPHRGKRNDSTMLKYIVAEIAKIKELSIEEVEKVTWDNAAKLFDVSL